MIKLVRLYCLFSFIELWLQPPKEDYEAIAYIYGIHFSDIMVKS